MKKKLLTIVALSLGMFTSLAACQKIEAEPSKPTDSGETGQTGNTFETSNTNETTNSSNTDSSPSTSDEKPQTVSVESVTIKNENKILNLALDEEESKKTGQIEVEVLPSSATQDVVYSSQDESIATVNQAGLVTAVKKGSTKVVVSSKEDSTKKDEISIVVKDDRTVLTKWVNKLKGSIKIEGKISEGYDLDNMSESKFTLAYSNEKYYLSYDGKELKYEKNHSNLPAENGKTVEKYLTYSNQVANKFITEDIDYIATNIDFDRDFKNPMASLTESDFEIDSRNEDSFSINSSKRNDVLSKLFFANSSLKIMDFAFTQIGDQLTGFGRVNSNTVIQCDFSFGQEAFEDLKPADEKEENKDIKEAQENMEKVESYSVVEKTLDKVYTTDGDVETLEDSTYNVKIANSASFKANITDKANRYDEALGWASFDDGGIYQFTYNPKEQLTGSSTYKLELYNTGSDLTDSIKINKASFSPVYDVNSAVFVKNSDGSFSILDSVELEAKRHILPSSNSKVLIQNATRTYKGKITSFKIDLEKDSENKPRFKEIKIDYEYPASLATNYKYDGTVKGSYTATYNYNSVDFSKFNFGIAQFNQPLDSSDSLIGNWIINAPDLDADDQFKDNGLVINISVDSNSNPIITLNGTSATAVSYRNNKLTFVFNNVKYEVFVDAQGCLNVLSIKTNEYGQPLISYILDNKDLLDARVQARTEIERYYSAHQSDIDNLDEESDAVGELSDKEKAAKLKEDAIRNIEYNCYSVGDVNDEVDKFKSNLDALLNGGQIDNSHSEEVTMIDETYYGKWILEDSSSLADTDPYKDGLTVEIIKVDDTHSSIKVNDKYGTDLYSDPSSAGCTIDEIDYTFSLNLDGQLEVSFFDITDYTDHTYLLTLDGSIEETFADAVYGSWSLSDADKQTLQEEGDDYASGLTIIITKIGDLYSTLEVNGVMIKAVEASPSDICFTFDGKEFTIYPFVESDNDPLQVDAGDSSYKLYRQN